MCYRRFGGLFGMITAVLLLVVACGGSAEPAPTAPPKASGTAARPGATPTSGPFAQPRFSPELKFPYMLARDWKDSDIRKGGVLVASTGLDTSNFDPRLSTAAGVMQTISPVYAKLVARKGGVEADPYALQPVPDLADRWELSADGSVYTFHLRKGVKWQDLPPVGARDVTAQDVLYSLDNFRQKSPPMKADLAVIDKVEVVDPESVRVTLKEPWAPFMATMIQPSMVILPKEVEDRDGDFKRTAIGAGPMIQQEFKPGASVVFKKNPTYYEPGKPYLDGYKLLVIKDRESNRATFLTGQIDLGAHTLDARSPAEIEEFQKRYADVAVIQYLGVPTRGGIAFDTKKAPYNDVRVRRALSLAIDRENMAKTVEPGWPVIWTLQLNWYQVLDTSPTLKDLGPWYQFDLPKAKVLMAEAGFANGFDAGEMIFSNAWTPEAMNWVQEDWKKLGVSFKLKVMEHVAYRAQFDKGDYSLASAGLVIKNEDFDGLASLIYSKGLNSFKVSDATLDQLIEQQRKTTDPMKRRAIFKQIWDREADQTPRLGAYVAPGTNMWRGYVRNYSGASAIAFGAGLAFLGRQISDVWLDERAPSRTLG